MTIHESHDSARRAKASATFLGSINSQRLRHDPGAYTVASILFGHGPASWVPTPDLARWIAAWEPN